MLTTYFQTIKCASKKLLQDASNILNSKTKTNQQQLARCSRHLRASGLVLCGVLGAVCVVLMTVQTPAQITGSDLSRTSVNRATGLKVKADGDPIGTIKAWPASHNPDTSEWLECNGGTFSKTTYPELFAVLGTTTLPDYTGRFLRGGKAADAGKKFEDSIKTHEVSVDDHRHSFSASFATDSAVKSITTSSSSMSVTGGGYAKTKSIEDYPTLISCYKNGDGSVQWCRGSDGSRTYGLCTIVDGIAVPAGGTINRSSFIEDYPTFMSCYKNGDGSVQWCRGSDGSRTYPLLTIFKNGSSSGSSSTSSTIISKVTPTTGSLSGIITGNTDYSGKLTGRYSGDSETAPKHTIIRYFIKAL